MRGRTLAVFASLAALVVSALIGVAPAQANTIRHAQDAVTSTAAAPTPAPEPPTPDGRMGQYPVAAYVVAAKQLPPALVAAVRRDLHLSAGQYLAQAAAGADAAETLATLTREGVHVRGSRLEGTRYLVYIDSDADAASVEKLGAAAERGPVGSVDYSTLSFSPDSNVYDGSSWYWTDGESELICTVGFGGYQVSTGSQQAVTAGHCFEGIGTIVGDLRQLSISRAGDFKHGVDAGVLGDLVPGSNQFGGDEDSGLISDPTVTQKPSALTWGGSNGAPLASTPTPIYDIGTATVGAPVCKSGSTTGWSCGTVLGVDDVVDVGSSTVNSIRTTACVLPGDSGGPLLSGGYALGVISASTSTTDCSGNYESTAFPMRSTSGASVTSQHSDWELGVTVPTPIITAPAAGGVATEIVGAMTASVASGSRLKAMLYLDGSTTPFATVQAPHGAFTFALSGVSAGTHTYTVKEVWGSRSTSASVASSFRKITVDRIAGADRYTNADLIAQQAYPSGADTVYLASGQNYPDALSAGPVAVHDGAPILLTQPTSLPSDVASTIATLHPTNIIVLGGVNSISDAVMTTLKGLVSDPAHVTRIGGADRIATSALLAKQLGTATTVFLSNGFNFPDALSAGPAAITRGAPVLLVNGSATALPSSTIAVLTALGATKVVITGGTASVSSGIETQLRSLLGSSNVQRLGGSDRYETSLIINETFFPSASRALISTGENFPDALAGGAYAGVLLAPLFTVRHDCVPADTSVELADLGVGSVTLLGGTSALNESVAALQVC